MTSNDYAHNVTICKEEFHQRINDNLFTNDDNNLSSFPIDTYNETKNSEEFPIFEFHDFSHNSFYEALNYEENALYFNINKDKINKTFDIKFQSKKINKKRGRKEGYQISDEKKVNSKIHDKFSSDNLRTKIHGHFLTFIISFVNEILSCLGYDKKFYKLDYNLIKNINNSFFKELRNKKIGEIISWEISPKLTKKKKNSNYNLYQDIKNDPILNKIFSQSYFSFFKIFYYPSNRKINLKKYGSNKEISLPENVKMLKDLLESCDNYDYKKKILNYTIKFFLTIFKTKKYHYNN